MRTYAFRLKPGQDLRQEIELFASREGIEAGFIITCVGSLEKAVLRMPNLAEVEYSDSYEIVGLVGTVSTDDSHLHLSMSDNAGNCIGGHVKYGCIVYTTAEVVMGEAEGMVFKREPDETTGFDELAIRKK